MTLPEGASEDLRGRFSGVLLKPDDPGYDEARRIHNGMVDRRPALIARCLNTADIVDAVNFGRDNGIEMTVRGGGHNIGGLAVSDESLMIDLSLMKGIYVDPTRRVARAQGGVTWSEYNRATGLHGLATTGGVISSTGIAGLTLGGGLGWLMGKYGMAVDNLISVELVNAAGEVRQVTDASDPDLFWALRGGGGNFGVAASFEYRCHPVDMIFGGLAAYPLGGWEPVYEAYRSVTSSASDDLTAFMGFFHAPDGSGFKIVGALCCHLGEVAQAEADVAPLRSAGTPVMDFIQPMPYQVLNTLLDATYPSGRRYYWKSSFLTDISSEAVATLASALEQAPSPEGGIVIEQFHGEVTRIAPEAMAYPHRTAGFNLLIANQWEDPANDEVNIAWVRETAAAMAPYVGEANYVNYLGTADDDTARVRGAYGPNWDRLVELKRRYDPDNLFHANHNIDPGS